MKLPYSLVLFLLVLTLHLDYGQAQTIVGYDFEDAADITAFKATGSSRIASDNTVSKSKKKSMLWSMSAGTSPKLKLNLPSPITGDEKKNGGLKFWIYRKSTAPTGTVMNINFKDTSSSSRSSPVKVYHSFKGWRAVWLGFREFGSRGPSVRQINQIEFAFEAPITQNEQLYIDLFYVTKKMSKQSRDKIVPNEGPISSPMYNERYIWQHTLKWSNSKAPSPDTAIDGVDIGKKIEEINEIENRLENWYAEKGNVLHDDRGGKKGSLTDFQKIRKIRWKSLLRSVDKATRFYDQLTVSKKTLCDKIIRPTLFSEESEFGNKEKTNKKSNKKRRRKKIQEKEKFEFVMKNIILPLALEYSLRSRDKEVEHVAEKECPNLKSKNTIDKGLKNIAGSNKVLQNFLKGQLPPSLDCSDQNDINRLKKSIGELNTKRLQRLNKLLDYIEEQGWADGSALGSLEFMMLTSGAGFMHSMFLLKDELRKDSCKLTKWINTMKWYSDFNAIYQTPDNYVYDASNADRMRTILLYRVMIVLMMPSLTDTEKQERIRDMRYVKNWVEYALKINKALGGVIKPDYTGFHHQAFYGPEYTTEALHTAALVQYLLEGTGFQLNNEAKTNLRSALEVMRIVAVKYSTPNGICGRFPSYSRTALARTTPAYAYISYVPGSPPTVVNPEMFLRLYDFSEPAIIKYFNQGRITSSIYYLNTIGSLDIMEKVKDLSTTRLTAEPSPSGHWSKSFGALAIHRRRDWAVAAKGFNNYVWDFEVSSSNNVYGVFQSHGSLQISNNEVALKSYDVQSGWDWTRIPGATTIDLKREQILTKIARHSRNFNPKHFAGGVGLRGRSGIISQNGVFGMELENPAYELENPLKNIKFSFKKSFFFLDHLIVCVGSNIILSPKNEGKTIPYFPQTTLFQDKRVSSSSSISIDDIPRNLGTEYPDTITSIAHKRYKDLKDTHGNIYRVTNPDSTQDLHVSIEDQSSKKDNGKTDTNARYATAWLKHTNSKGTSSYLYSILINGGTSDDLNKFTVKQRNGQAHVVEFDNLPQSGTKTTGYSVFERNSDLSGGLGPVLRVDEPCTIMTEETSGKSGSHGTLHIALSDPAFRFEKNPAMMSKDVCKRPGIRKRDPPGHFEDVRSYLMFCVQGKPKAVKVTLTNPVISADPTNVFVDNEDKTADKNSYVMLDNTRKVITFKNLKNGFSTEAVFNT